MAEQFNIIISKTNSVTSFWNNDTHRLHYPRAYIGFLIKSNKPYPLDGIKSEIKEQHSLGVKHFGTNISRVFNYHFGISAVN